MPWENACDRRELGPWARLLLCACGLLFWACNDGEKKAPQPAHAAPEKPSARLILMTDLQGYLEPCGCQARPLGGIDRAATRLAELRGEGIPSAVIAAGDLLFEDGDAHKRTADRASAQERWKAETLVGILNDVGLAAASPGPGDLREGADTLSKLLADSRFALLGAVAQGASARASARGLLTVGELKVGLLSVSGTDAGELIAQAEPLLSELRSEGAQVTLAIVQADAREARRMAGQIRGLDFIVLTGRDSDDALPPSVRGDTVLLNGSRHGRGLLVLDVYHRAAGPYADVSEWTRAAAQQALQRQADDLRARIAEWEKDPKVDRKQLATQKQRLSGLEASLARPAGTDSTAKNAFSARFVELDSDVPKQPKTAALLSAYDERVNRHNKEAFADWKPEPAKSGQAAYVGSEQCKTCHAPAYTWWRSHPHGHAYATLQTRNKEYNLSCVGCHVTGYLEPGGSTVTHVEGLTDVGCESCHGPGSLHNGDVEHIVRAPREAVCVTCHNDEHSDAFEFDSYRARLIVPGHGLPAPEAQ